RPVWLMNPDVASRVLPLRRMFDSVIFDEASQMPVEHALPALYRGEVLVVSGDEKQMPPTSFFSSKVENDEADVVDEDEPEDGATDAEREAQIDTWNRRDIKDCPDLLHLAREMLPKAMLEIHYRSAYRELIDFSNASFYGSRLNVPVQHPREKIREARPIEFEFIGGRYDNQSNPAEAKRVSDILQSIWRKPGERPSIGVVTFNRKQADLIADVLEETAEGDPAFRQTLVAERERVDHGEDMSFFVKNVENVQGDERDIIIFSTTFGRNEAGAFRRFFGVLGQTGGERRLNVAVTRARRKILVVSSMPIGAISDMLITQRAATTPRDYLQAYLEYARALSAGEFDGVNALLSRVAGGRGAAVTGHAAERDGFSDAVANFIQDLGWETQTIDGSSAFGMDLAIIDPNTGLYGIGIECDAPRHKMLEQARAREIWRPRVLTGTFPRLHRVSSKGWYHNPLEEQRALKDAIELALGRRERQ
ncbi:histidine kinase, partial [Prosthecomicrobium hirschii]|uniref:AAA domain-containing protein n=1 Tax=Prosthecodimorpha hirschii TaxID=665126 RepID=UPI001DFB45E8